MSNCIEIINEEIKFPLGVEVKFNFYNKDELKELIEDLETIEGPMAEIDDLIEILKSKLA